MRLAAVMILALLVVGAPRLAAHTHFYGSVYVNGTAPDACAGEATHVCIYNPDPNGVAHPWHGPVTIDFGSNTYYYVGNVAVVPSHRPGEACSDVGQCLRPCSSSADCGGGACANGFCDAVVAGYCVDGVCCGSACDQGCGTCNQAGSLGTCVPKAKATVCRALAGDCDKGAETCPGPCAPGTTGCPDPFACPADDLYQLADHHACRPAAGDCDVAEECRGGAECPADALADPNTPCRMARGECDRTDYCQPGQKACGHDDYDVGRSCRAAVGGCDLEERCVDGLATCPGDQLVAAGTVCRATAGACDVDDVCTGVSGLCPDDVMPSGAVCGPNASCTGSSRACPGAPFATCTN